MDNAVDVILRALQRGSQSSADPFYDKWSAEASRMAEGINASGVVAGIDGLATSLDALAFTVSTELVQLNASVDVGFSNLSDILRNPLGTQVEERLRRGLTALGNLWIEDAIRELTLALELDPMLYQAHYALAVALQQSGQGSAAVGQFERAAKYSLPTDPELAAGAVLQAQAIAFADGRTGEAIRLIRQWAPSLRCAELDLRLAILDETFTALDAAFNEAPELILPTALSGARQVLGLAEQLDRERWRPYNDAKKLQDAIREATFGKTVDNDALRFALLPIPDASPELIHHVVALLSRRREILHAALSWLQVLLADTHQVDLAVALNTEKKKKTIAKKQTTIAQLEKTLVTDSLLTSAQAAGEASISDSLARVESAFQEKRRSAVLERARLIAEMEKREVELIAEMEKREVELSIWEGQAVNQQLLRSKYSDLQARISGLLHESSPYALRRRPRFELRRTRT